MVHFILQVGVLCKENMNSRKEDTIVLRSRSFERNFPYDGKACFFGRQTSRVEITKRSSTGTTVARTCCTPLETCSWMKYSTMQRLCRRIMYPSQTVRVVMTFVIGNRITLGTERPPAIQKRTEILGEKWKEMRPTGRII